MSVNKSVRTAGTLAGTLLVTVLMIGDTSSAAGATMAMAPQGSSRTVSMQDLCGDCTPEKFVQCGDFLEGPAFDDKGNLWMVSIESGNIEKVTPDGQCATAAKTGGEPQGLKFHDGKLYGVDRKRGVFTIDPTTGKGLAVWGAPFAQCTHCGAQNLPDQFKFCGNCGQALKSG